ncbi:MAG: LamG domain-containing protein, partial [Candidatus Sedimenticola sp. (ex Thyasira tokunagai)]
MADTTTNTPNATEQAANYTLEISRQEFSGVTFTQGSEEKGATPNDLIGELPGGEKFVLADYLVLVKATDGALPPPLTLNDGTVIDGAEVLAALGDINLDLVGDTAAGGQTGPNATGNAGFSVYFPEGLGDNLLHGPYAPDPGDLGAGDEGSLLFGQQTLGTLDIEVLTDVEISGYEDAQPNQHIGDYTLALMKVNIAMTPSNEATYRDSLTLNDIPDGAVLYVGGTDAANIVTVVGGSYTIELLTLSETDQEALLDSVYMIAPDDSDVDYPLTAEAVFGGPTGDLAVPADTTVIVDAVADMPVDLDAGFASSELLVNGDFETGDLSGWRVDFINGGFTDGFYIDDDADAQTPFSGFPSAGPASGGFYAVGDQIGPSAQAIEQTFDVPAGATQVMFSADLFLNNHAGGYVVGTGLDPNIGQNQYARIDILAEGSAPFDTTADVIHSIIIDEDSDLVEDPVTGYAHYEVDISAWVTAGESYDIRFSAVQTDFHMNFGLDNVSIKAAGAVVPPSNPDEPASSEPDPSTFDLSISAVFDDVEDGSEAHLIFARVPKGFEAVRGSDGYQGVITVNGDGTISYDDGGGTVTFAANMAELAEQLRGTPLVGEAFDGTVPEDQAIDLPEGIYAVFELTAAEMTSNADAAMSPSYTANVTVTLQAPDRWDMEEGPDGWQVVGGDIGFDAEDLDGEPGDDSGVMIDDTGVVEFSVPTWALAVDIPTEPDTELTYENNVSLVSAGVVDIAVDPVHGELSVEDAAGFEDMSSGDNDTASFNIDGDDVEYQVPAQEIIDEDPAFTTPETAEGPIALTISFAVPDNELVTRIEIAGVPVGGEIVDTQDAGGTDDYNLYFDGPNNVWVIEDAEGLGLAELDGLAFVPPQDSDLDQTFTVTATFVDPDTGHTLTRTGEIDVTVDAVAEQASIDLVGDDATTTSLNAYWDLDDSGDQGPDDYIPDNAEFETETAVTRTYTEDHSADAAGDTSTWGGGEEGWTTAPDQNYEDASDQDPIYNVGFMARVNDWDTATTSSESITEIRLLPGIELAGFQTDDSGDALVTWMLEDQAIDSDGTVPADFTTAFSVTVDGSSAGTMATAQGVSVDAATGELVITFSADQDITSVDLSALGVQLPKHSDDDVTLDLSVKTEEVPTDTELTTDNNVTYQHATINLVVEAVADGAGIDTSAQRGGSLELDGSNFLRAEIDVNEGGSGTDGYTASFWFNTTETGVGLFSVIDSTDGNLNDDHDRHLYLDGDGNIRARVWSNETIDSNDTNYADGQWHHVAHVLDGSNQIIYIDGVQVAIGNKGVSNFNWQEDVLIGRSVDAATDNFDGQMADVQVYNAALSGADVQALMSGQIHADLALQYNFEASDPTIDKSGNGYDAIEYGVPVYGEAGPIYAQMPLTIHAEDAGVTGAQGAETGHGQYINLDITANLVDQDGSEIVSQIVITLDGADAGADLVNVAGDSLATTDTVELLAANGAIVTYDVVRDGQIVTLTIQDASKAAAQGQDISLNGAVRAELPHDDSTDFDAVFTVTTSEAFPEGTVGDSTVAPTVDTTDYTTETSVHHVVHGVVATAEATLSALNDAEVRITDDEAGADEIVVLTEDNGVTGAQGLETDEVGRMVNFAYTASTQDNDGTEESEGIVSIELNKGVSDGSWVFTAANLDVTGEGGTSPTLVQGTDYTVVDAGQTLTITFTDPNAIESVTLDTAVSIQLPIDDSTDFDLTVTTTTQEFDDDGVSTTTPDTASTSNVLHFEIQGEVAEAVTVLSAQGDVADSDPVVDDTVDPEPDTVVLYEDNGVAGAQGDETQGGTNTDGRVINFTYTARTQDNDNSAAGMTDGSVESEGIVSIELDKTLSDGSWVFDAAGMVVTGEDGQPLTLTEDTGSGGDYTVTGLTGAVMTITFADPNAIESVDISQAVSIQLPIDDSTDFDLTITTTTQEFDDDQTSTNPAMPNATAEKVNTLHFEIQGEVAEAVTVLSAQGDVPDSDPVVDEDGTEPDTVVLYEDNGLEGAQGDETLDGDNADGRVINFTYTARTQDDDNSATGMTDGSVESEGIVSIELNKGVSDGSWVFDGAGMVVTGEDGQTLTLTEDTGSGGDYTVTGLDAAIMTIAFTDPNAIESVDISQAVSILLPIDDSTDFDLTVTTTTQEFDDDGVSVTDPATAETSNVLHFEIQGEVAEADATLSAFDDAGSEVTTGTVVLTEDNGVPGAQGMESPIAGIIQGIRGRLIEFDYTAKTQDYGPNSDDSEAITRIVLDKGACEGGWVYDSDGDGTLGLTILDGNGAVVTEADAGLAVLDPNVDG